MLIGDTFFPLFGLDQDRICFISEIALDSPCSAKLVRLEKVFRWGKFTSELQNVNFLHRPKPLNQILPTKLHNLNKTNQKNENRC